MKMDTHNFVIEQAPWNECEQACSAIRHQVFIVEQAVPEHEEWDGLDADARHFLVTRRDNQEHVACARLLTLQSDGIAKITRMAVLAPYRNQGIGRALLQTMIIQATKYGFKKLVLDAQLHALEFYALEGFQAIGNVFIDAGIEHRKMFREV
jgi:predicted GNAT family N-acyltransferase